MAEWNITEKKQYTVSTPTFDFTMDAPRYGAFQLKSCAGIQVDSLFAQFDDESEDSALKTSRRVHTGESGMELSLDMSSPIPFGAEPEISRNFRLIDNYLAVTTVFSMRHSMKMQSIFAGGLAFSGAIDKIGIVRIPATPDIPAPAWTGFDEIEANATFYSDEMPPLALILMGKNKATLRFELGESIWRWINAPAVGGTSKYTLQKKDGKIVFSWQLFTFHSNDPEQLPPDGRDWRILYSLTAEPAPNAKKAKKAVQYKSVFDFTAEKWASSALVSNTENTVCMSSDAVEKALKKWIRRQFADAKEGDVFGIRGATPHFCTNAAHADRAKRKTLAHWDRPSLLEFLRWANRQLDRYGAKCVLMEEE